MKEVLGRNCKAGGLPGPQARPQGEDAYNNEESCESEDDSTADGGKSVTPPGKLEKGPELVQFIQSYNDVQACREWQCRVPALTVQPWEIRLTARILT